MKPLHAAAALAVVALVSALPARAEVVERVAGVVNGQPIPLSEVAERAAPDLAKADRYTPAERATARKEALQRALDTLVDEKLIEGEAATFSLDVSEEETNKSVEALARQNGLTPEQFKEELARQKVDFAVVKDQLKRQALRFKLLQAKVKPRKVTDEEIKAAYSARIAHQEFEVRARHIFIRIPQNATPAQEAAAKAKADLAVERLAKGEEFALVARDLSDGPTAKQGGSLGYFKRGMLLPELETAAMALQTGQSSSLIKTPAGYHLVHVEDRRALPAKPLSEMENEIRASLANENVTGEQTRFLQQLRKSAQVDLRL